MSAPPDPPRGLSFADFRAALERYRATLAAEAEIRRLERAFALPAAAPWTRSSPGERGPGVR